MTFSVDPAGDYVVVHRSKSLLRTERWRWTRFSANHRKIATSSEGYRDRRDVFAMASRCNPGIDLREE